MTRTIAISGASGKTGYRIAEEVLAAGDRPRLLLRPNSVVPDSLAGCEQHRLDLPINLLQPAPGGAGGWWHRRLTQGRITATTGGEGRGEGGGSGATGGRRSDHLQGWDPSHRFSSADPPLHGSNRDGTCSGPRARDARGDL